MLMLLKKRRFGRAYSDYLGKSLKGLEREYENSPDPARGDERREATTLLHTDQGQVRAEPRLETSDGPGS